ncbi:glycosyltransferase [Lignipirellula cremea]|uniref:glycosyltransferase n=1 Tax=Lignipirellula cremea TaxID=2528010 RepID=UPI0018D1F9B1|nr:glycosyltransferase [Lignipirellula cremea]
MKSENRTPLRLALVITELEVGGAERCLANLALHVDRERFAPQVYSLGPRPIGDQAALVDQLEAAGVPLHFLNAASLRHLPGAVLKLQRLLQEQQAQVIQSFLFHANVVSGLAARRLPAGLAFGIRVADPRRWRQQAERWLSRHAQQIVCVSQSVARFAAEAGFAPDKLAVIPNGIDLDAIPPDGATKEMSAWGAPGRKGILFVGRLHPQKGVDLLLQAAPAMLAAAPEHDLFLAGDGPERAACERLAASSGMGSRIHFLGWRPDVGRIMAASDLFLLPSRWEGMPNALIEAMAHGLPVVVSQVEGVAEVLGPQHGEQLFTPGDAAELQEKATRLLANPLAMARLGAANRHRIGEAFTLPGMVRQYENLWGMLASTGS